MTMTAAFLDALLTYETSPSGLPCLEGDHPAPGETAAPLGSLPAGALLLGSTEDGQAVSLELSRPGAAPVLVTGDGGSGKTALLQQLARNSILQDPGEVQFGVLTPFPDEWRGIDALPSCLGVWPVYHASATRFLAQLVSWAAVLPETREGVLLLVDGLDQLSDGGILLRHHLRWLLQNGPEGRVWPVVSVNPGRLTTLPFAPGLFPTRLFGQVRDRDTARELLPVAAAELPALAPGLQFAWWKDGRAVRFQIPAWDGRRL